MDCRTTKGLMLYLIITCAFTVASRGEASAAEICGIALAPSASTASPPANGFKMVRFGAPGSLEFRDLEFAFDTLYVGVSATQRQNTLSRWRESLSVTGGVSPVATDANNLRAVYNYFRREGANWTLAGDDTTSFQVGWNTSATADQLPLSAYKPLDRSHVDVYVVHPSNPARFVPFRWDGISPAPLRQSDEDVTTAGRSANDTRGANAIGLVGPLASAIVDEAGVGWTNPARTFRTTFDHELTHSFPGNRPNYGSYYDELMSAGAEAVGGIFGTTTVEFPYTEPFIHVYQARRAFMAYLVYNFLNADSNRTVAGMADDLVKKWREAHTSDVESSSLGGLRSMLSDANCQTCLSANYFRPNGIPLPLVDRLNLLIHNWRVAMFANSSTVAERQYGYPAWSGYTPSGSENAWRSVNGIASDDVVALPAIVQVGAAQARVELGLAGSRSFRGGTEPLSLKMFGANYWVLRAAPDAQTTNRDLTVRITPLSHIRAPGQGARLMASAVAYNHADTSSAEESSLWRHPEWISAITPLQYTEVDSITNEIEVVVPNFGLTNKAVVLVLSLADGRNPYWTSAAASGFDDGRAMPYRLGLGLRRSGATSTVAVFQATQGQLDVSPVWSPDGGHIAFCSVQTGISPLVQVYRKPAAGGVPVCVAPQLGINQFWPDWSPRGDKIVYEGRNTDGTSYLWLCDPFGGNPTQLTQVPQCATFPAFQPDGQGIAYLHFDGSTWALRWVAIDGTGDRFVAAVGVLGGGSPRPRWSSDGTKIYLTLQGSGDRIGWVSRNGGSWNLLSKIPTACSNFDIHPGVGFVATTPAIPLPNTLRALQAGGTLPDIIGLRLALTDTSLVAPEHLFRFNVYGRVISAPRYSPDGVSIAFQAASGSDADIYVATSTANRPPHLLNIQDEGFAACVPFEIPLAASDADGDTVRYEVFQKPPGVQLLNTNVLRWTRPAVGDYFVIIRAIDTRGAVDQRAVKWHVFDDGSCQSALVAGGGGGSAATVSTASLVSPMGQDDAVVVPAAEPEAGNTLLDGAVPGAWVTSCASVASSEPAASFAGAIDLGNVSNAPIDVDFAKLLVISHAPGTQVISVGDDVVVGQLSALQLSSLVADGETEVVSGTTLSFTLPASGSVLGLCLTCRRTGEAVVNDGNGIRVQVASGSEWTTVGIVHPRRLSDRFGVALPGGAQVRLLFDVGTLVRAADAILAPDPGLQGSTRDTLALVAASGSVGDPLAQADSNPLVLGAGQSLTLASVPSEGASGMSTEYFLLLRARLTAASPASALMARRETTDDSSAARGTPVGPVVPARFSIGGATPNPFSDVVEFSIGVPRQSSSELDVLDLQGRRVRELVHHTLAAGFTTVRWDGRDDRGAFCPHGVYLVRFRAGTFQATRRVVLMRK